MVKVNEYDLIWSINAVRTYIPKGWNVLLEYVFNRKPLGVCFYFIGPKNGYLALEIAQVRMQEESIDYIRYIRLIDVVQDISKSMCTECSGFTMNIYSDGTPVKEGEESLLPLCTNCMISKVTA